MIVEFAFIFPLAILLSIGIADLGILFWTIEDTYRVTVETARCGAVDTSGKCPDLPNYAKSIGYPMSSVEYTAQITACGNQPAGSLQSGVLVTGTIKSNFLVDPLLQKFFQATPMKNSWTISTCFSKSI